MRRSSPLDPDGSAHHLPGPCGGLLPPRRGGEGDTLALELQGLLEAESFEQLPAEGFEIALFVLVVGRRVPLDHGEDRTHGRRPPPALGAFDGGRDDPQAGRYLARHRRNRVEISCIRSQRGYSAGMTEPSDATARARRAVAANARSRRGVLSVYAAAAVARHAAQRRYERPRPEAVSS